MNFLNLAKKLKKSSPVRPAPASPLVSYQGEKSSAASVSDTSEYKYKRNLFLGNLIQTQELDHDPEVADDHARRLFRHCAYQGFFGNAGNLGRSSAICLKGGEDFAIVRAEGQEDNLKDYVAALDMQLAIVIDNPIAYSIPVRLLAEHIAGDKHGLQVLECLSQLSRARLDQPVAYCAQEKLFVVWSQDPEKCMDLAKTVNDGLQQIVWNDEKDVGGVEVVDVEVGSMEGESAPDNILRKRRILVPFFVSCAFLAWGAFFGLILQKLLQEYRYDGSTYRFAYIAYFPITFVMSLFFVLVVIKNVYEIFGPVGMAFRNSFAYSAIPPKRMTGVLPQITIQCPVYKESLADVIEPTITSVKVAMRRYEKQGGTVNLVVCDDRMQLVDERSQEFRKAYYRKNSIGWVARPGHGVDGYVRAGRFKKASNLNTMMGVSVKVEERLKQIDRSNPEGWTPIDEERAYRSILSNVIAEDGRVWAEGNIRLGELILLIDSDTRVPSDCLLDAASEFAESPHLAVLQHASGVMHVSWDFFERGMAYFTSHIYRSIRISCASGDLAPFVGHNAFIRWSAVQTAAEWTHPDDGQPRWWSESHVSEDFEMALKLQCAGHSIRLAAYTKGEFREGVSLTVADEITRWEKYAYGCSELMFNPIRTWLWRSPFTPLFRQFLSTRSIPLFAKFTLLSYVGTYYALGAVWVFTFANYFFTGWAANLIDHVYADSFSTLISILVVFYGLSPLAGSIVSYKLGDKSFFRAMVETVKWTPFFSLFFSGISFRISAALLSHLFEYNMQWGATTKEVTNSDLFTELPKIFRDFRYTYLFFGIQIPMMLYLAFGAPYQWVINGLNSCFPLAVCIVGHMLLPLLLNPSLFKV